MTSEVKDQEKGKALLRLLALIVFGAIGIGLFVTLIVYFVMALNQHGIVFAVHARTLLGHISFQPNESLGRFSTVLIISTLYFTVWRYSNMRWTMAESTIFSHFPALFFNVFMMVLGYACLYFVHGLNCPKDYSGHLTMPDALYFSAVSWTTVGYGDFSPSPATRFIAVSEAFVGYLTMGLVVAILVSALNRASRNGERASIED